EVILVSDVGGGNLTGNNSVCTFLANYVPRFYSNTSLGCSQIYDNGSTTVGIGMAAGGNTAFRFHMKGDFLIQPENSTDRGDIYMQDASVGNRRVFAMYGSGGNSTLAIGPGAGGSSGSATRSLYVGNNAGNLTDDETRNTFVGASAGEVWTGTSTTGWNTMIGSAAGVAMTGGNHNTFLGERSGNTFASGDSNTFVGAEAGNGGLNGAARNNILIGNSAVVNATNGSENIVIGVEAQALQTGGTATNRVSIGYKNRVSCDNCFTIAAQIGTNFTEQHVGIGFDGPNTTIPATGTGPGGIAKLYVSGWNNGGTPANIISSYFAGAVYTTGTFVPSDLNLKDNVQPFTDASAIIDQLEAKSYNFKHNAYPTMNLPNGNQIGFLADDVAAVAPQLIQGFSNPAKLDAAGNVEVPQVDFVGVNYAGLVPILFTAIKQQKAMLDSLAVVVSNCCNNPQPLINNNDNPLNKSSIALTNNETIILNQNAPNPFEDKTEISYNIPESVQEAQILFYDQSGKVLHKFEISHRGQGALTVFGEDLSSGMYSYTLIIDGKNHQTKRMMKQ
ncbi:MAG TPA: tail fiber domain-containing protein, partial [Bacteroidia bacterium]|nr:tail fiber domain-containing protein [Bacteroidia bacterium]